MNGYNKLALGILVILNIMIIISCSPLARYQENIFDNENKIAKQVDSYTYIVYIK